jgi:hypothetical protein
MFRLLGGTPQYVTYIQVGDNDSGNVTPILDYNLKYMFLYNV